MEPASRFRNVHRLGFAVLAATLSDPLPVTGAMVSPQLAYELDHLGPAETTLAWIFFADKGPGAVQKLSPLRVTERCVRRRVRAGYAAVDAGDLPVETAYVEAVASRVTRIRQRSRWFNAVSAVVTREEVMAVATLPCVRSIEPLLRLRRRNEPTARSGTQLPGTDSSLDLTRIATSQLEQLGVPELHAWGITGQGVLIAHFDGGYDRLSHEALRNIHVVAAHDFVSGDSDPSDHPTDRSWQHGDATLSVIAGYRPGILVGSAYGADYLLARTEEALGETPLEEDHWVAGIEWADSLGADVSTTSLGYLEYTGGYRSWSWRDMNGNSTVITRAADAAVARGIVVVNSAGNAGVPQSSYMNTLVAPADGDSVLAVGAVDDAGQRVAFSSMGPTANVRPRIKPDVMAQGKWVLVANSVAPDTYTLGDGTSFSCPLVAGVAALLLSARPHSTPMQILDALRLTASHAGNPNNQYGWGIVDAPAALAHLRSLDAGLSVRFEPGGPNPFDDVARVRYVLPAEMLVSLRIFDARGRYVRTLFRGNQVARTYSIEWDGRDAAGHSVPSGVYFCRLQGRNDLSLPVRSTSARIKLVRLAAH